MIDFIKYITKFKDYVNNPSMILPQQEKKIFDEDIIEISKRVGGGGFLGLFKRKVTPEAIVSYKATKLVYDMISSYLESKGFDEVHGFNVPSEVYPLSYDDHLNKIFVKDDLYVSVYGRGIWFSPHYQLNVNIYKDFDFNMYKEELANKYYSAYNILRSDKEYYPISFDFDPKDLHEAQHILKEVQDKLNTYSKLNIHTIRNLWYV